MTTEPRMKADVTEQAKAIEHMGDYMARTQPPEQCISARYREQARACLRAEHSRETSAEEVEAAARYLYGENWQFD